ncbi:glycosyltransferase [Parasedimentitalea huanghaiensis]|uniref:Glycosyltransferase n=1 Tax=Parasedimentitalea huanghaiensis TaxID=2682100 RepID=A0A6L6WL93_9RHOB|nr:glycosyltransferase [Zongyanglinia huanghaiensis]MVO18626.1 glycosyltransferase [Zongyanglinia huanghaiensis]
MTRNTDLKLSVGMPVYNGEAYIAEAITSLLEQTRGDFELIISDNASTDSTSDIIKEFAKQDPRIRFFQQDRNLGVVANFHFVLDKSQASNFMWAAADDVWDRRWVEALLPLALERPCLAYGRLMTIDAEGKRLTHPANDRAFEFSGNRLGRRLRYFLMPGLIGKANPFYGIFRRDKIPADFFEIVSAGKLGVDVLALYHFLAQSEIVSGGEVFLLKRTHDQSVANDDASRSGSRLPLRARLFRKTQLLDFLELSTPIEKLLLVALCPLAWVLRKRAQKNFSRDLRNNIQPR